MIFFRTFSSQIFLCLLVLSKTNLQRLTFIYPLTFLRIIFSHYILRNPPLPSKGLTEGVLLVLLRTCVYPCILLNLPFRAEQVSLIRSQLTYLQTNEICCTVGVKNMGRYPKVILRKVTSAALSSQSRFFVSCWSINNAIVPVSRVDHLLLPTHCYNYSTIYEYVLAIVHPTSMKVEGRLTYAQVAAARLTVAAELFALNENSE